MRRKWWIVGVLVFLELLVCASIVVLVRAGWSRFDGVRFFYASDTHVEDTIEQTFAVDGPAALDVAVFPDDVTVTGGTEGEIEVVARLSLWGEDEEDAREQVDVTMTQEGNRVTVRVEHVQRIYAFAYSRGSRADLEIRVPEGTAVCVESSSGDVTVRDVVGTADLCAIAGKIDVEGFNGEMKVEASSGGVSLTDLANAGEMVVQTTAGNVTLENVEAEAVIIGASSGDVAASNLEAIGDVTIRTTSGHVKLKELAAASLDVDVSSGGVEVAGLSVAGDVDIETSSGDVGLESLVAGGLKIKGFSAQIDISGGTIDGRLDAENTSSRVSVAGVEAASYRLVSSSGDVSLDECGGPLTIRTIAGAIEVENAAEAQLEFETSSGGVSFSGSLAAGGLHTIKSTSGDVRLKLPNDSAFDLDISTTAGDIKTDFVVGATSFDHNRLVGKVNAGGALLEIKTSSGNVTLVSVD
jgi:DUF4097 and DUF4098 domain-containing protein YvlB